MKCYMPKLKKKKDADKVPENKNRSDSKGSKPSSIVTPQEKATKKEEVNETSDPVRFPDEGSFTGSSILCIQ